MNLSIKSVIMRVLIVHQSQVYVSRWMDFQWAEPNPLALT